MSSFYVCTSYDVFNPQTGLYYNKLDCIEWDTELMGPYNGPMYSTKKECIDNSICSKTNHQSNNYCNISIQDVNLLSKTDEEIILSVTLPSNYDDTYLHHALYNVNNDLLRDWQPTELLSTYSGCIPEGAAIRLSVVWVERFIVANGGSVQLRRRYTAVDSSVFLGLNNLIPYETINSEVLIPNNSILNFDYYLINIDGQVVNLGETINILFKIENIGKEPLSIDLQTSDPSGNYSQLANCIENSFSLYSLDTFPESLIQPGSFTTMEVSFPPLDSGTYCAKFYLATNDLGGPRAPKRPERPCQYYEFFIVGNIENVTL